MVAMRVSMSGLCPATVVTMIAFQSRTTSARATAGWIKPAAVSAAADSFEQISFPTLLCEVPIARRRALLAAKVATGAGTGP